MATGVAVVAVLCALALPAAAEGPGYGGDAGGLSIRVLGASEDRADAQAPATAPRTPSSGGLAVEVSATGFLAGSTTEVRVGDAAAVTVPTDERGRLSATVPFVGPDPGGTWVSVTGTDPGFQRKVVAATVPSDGGDGPPSSVVALGAAAAAMAGSVVVGVRRGRQDRGQST